MLISSIFFVFQFMRQACSLFLLARLTKNIINFLFSWFLIPYTDYYDHRLVNIFSRITLVIQWQTTTVIFNVMQVSVVRDVMYMDNSPETTARGTTSNTSKSFMMSFVAEISFILYTCFLIRRTLQMKDRWESNKSVWFRFMYSQKWNCVALLFPK